MLIARIDAIALGPVACTTTSLVVVVVLHMPGWLGGSPLGSQCFSWYFITCWLLLVNITLSGWCFLRLLLVISSCHPGIIPRMGCLLRGVLLPQTYKVWRSVIATHSIMMCFWSSWWASQNLQDVMYMFPWYFAFWLAFTGIMLLLVILVLHGIVFCSGESCILVSCHCPWFLYFPSNAGLGHLVCFCWDFLCCHLFVHYV